MFKNMSNRVLFEKPRLKTLNGLGYKCFDLHYHTRYSDGKNGVKIAIKKANRLRFGFAVTDHDEIRGAVEAHRRKECTIIPGIEVTSRELYDLLVYFYDVNDLIEFYVKHIRKEKQNPGLLRIKRTKLSFVSVLEAAEDYNCLIAPAHPFAMRPKTSYEIFEEHPSLLKKFDAIETINGTMTQNQNIKCFNWAQKLDKPMIGGSDAHAVAQLGSIINAVKEDSVEGVLNAIKKEKHILIGKGLNVASLYYHNLEVIRKNIFNEIKR